MNKSIFIILLCLLLLTGCALANSEDDTYPLPEYKKVDAFGELPEEFAQIVESDLFRNGVAFSDCVLKQIYVSECERILQAYDYSGKLLLEKTIALESDAHLLCTLTATEDGGFLYVIGFSDKACADGTWASEKGVWSTVVKCDSGGDIQWQLKCDGYTGWMLHTCFEMEDGYYFFGEQETPGTNVLGVASPTDIHILKLSKAGQIAEAKNIGGSDYDSLSSVDISEQGFVLNCWVQSEDGDFSSKGYWEVVLDRNLSVLSLQTAEMDYADVVGYLDGKPIRRNNKLFDNFRDGSVMAFLNYGDFYLIVSDNITGYSEYQPPMLSVGLFNHETVYGAYDKEGNLLWRATVDATMDIP